MNLQYFAFRNVFRNKRRTFITASIFCVGTISLFLAAGYVFATFHGLRELTISGEFGHLQIGKKDSFEDNEVRLFKMA